MFSNWKCISYRCSEDGRDVAVVHDRSSSNPDMINMITDICFKYNFPSELSNLFFKYVNDTSIIQRDESYFFFPELCWIIKSSERFSGFIDIALCYQGMGHYQIISWDMNRRSFFVRCDGGSNGYEKEDNEKRFESSDFYEGIDTTKTFDLETFQKIIDGELIYNEYQV